MLHDRDRIFTNLYGEHSPGLEAARGSAATGTGPPDLVQQGRDWLVAAGQGQRPARARRGRVRHRAEMVVHAQAGDRTALSRRQCRRIRARHLQGPGDHAPRPAQAGRGLPDRRRRHGRARPAYIYIRGEFIREGEALEAAIDEAYGGGAARQERLRARATISTLYLHRGAGAYICGEETALLESLEGKKGQPRLKPPFPAMVGLYGRPTHGQQCRDHRRRRRPSCGAAPAWFAGIGRPNNTGTKIYCISGHVNRPVRGRGRDGHPACAS